MKRSLLAVALCAAALVVPVTANASTPAPTRGALKHIVVMPQSGRSFDNYFGSMRGVDGIGQVPCQLQATKSQMGCIGVHPIKAGSPNAALRTGAEAQRISIDRGRMDGFVRAQDRPGADGTLAMGYYPSKALPLLDTLAHRGVLFDHWFSGVAGGPLANDLFGITANPLQNRKIVPTAGWPDQPVIFDRLTAAGISWRIYVQNYEPALTIQTAATKQRLGGQVTRVPLLAFPRYLENPALMSHIVGLDQYYSDLERHTLPAVSYVISTSATELAPRDPVKGHRLIRSVLNALLLSDAWSSSALIVNWDSSGGWYDHVPPPVLDGAPAGLRVPAILISPFAHPGTVDGAQFDAASVLKLIEKTFGVAPLTARDRDAGDLTSVLSFRADAPRPALVPVTADQPVRQPQRGTLVLGYVAALLVAICAAAVALIQAEREHRRKKVAMAS
jgi:phospholipase C